MDYANLKTYKTQLKYIKKIYQIKVNETDYLNKTNELIKIFEKYEGIFDNEDVSNVRSDISFLEGKIEEDKQLIKKHSELIEHIEILCQNGGSPDIKYLDTKPKHAVKWVDISVQKIGRRLRRILKTINVQPMII